MILEIILTGILLGFYWVWLNTSRLRKNLPPGPTPIFPIIGNIPQLSKYKGAPTYETFDKLANQYGPVVLVKFGGLYQLVVQDLNLGKELLSSDIWVDRYFDDMIAERSFGKQLGIIFGAGDMWKETRRFTVRTLRDFGFGKQTSMEVVLEEELALLTHTLDKSAHGKSHVSMRQFFTVSILNILWSMIAGFRFPHDDKKLKELINMVDVTSKSNPLQASMIQAFPFLWFLNSKLPKYVSRRKFVKSIQDFFVEIFDERKASKSYKTQPKDFIDVFLREIDIQKEKGAEPNYFSEEHVIMICFDLFVAGAETTSNTLEFAFLYMILNPEVQRKVQEEIDRVVGKNQKPSLLEKTKLPYTEATLLEVQRLANVLPIVFRGATQDTSVGGYNVPKGTLAGVNVSSLHQDEKIWGDPQNFRPERFLDSENNIINSHKLLPFGLGKRVCLGEVLARASLFSYFATLLQRYTFEPSPHHPIPTTNPVYGFTLSPKEYFVTVNQR